MLMTGDRQRMDEDWVTQLKLEELGFILISTAQWAKSGFFVQWVYWVYLFSQNIAHCAPTVQCCNV